MSTSDQQIVEALHRCFALLDDDDPTPDTHEEWDDLLRRRGATRGDRALMRAAQWCDYDALDTLHAAERALNEARRETAKRRVEEGLAAAVELRDALGDALREQRLTSHRDKVLTLWLRFSRIIDSAR